MGWGAAMALAEEWADWCDGPEEAYEILYGRDDTNKSDGVERVECPICGKNKRGVDGVIDHMTAKHTKPCHAETISSFKGMYGRLK